MPLATFLIVQFCFHFGGLPTTAIKMHDKYVWKMCGWTRQSAAANFLIDKCSPAIIPSQWIKLSKNTGSGEKFSGKAENIYLPMT